MKKTLLLTTALVLGSVTLSFAGGLAEPLMTEEVVAQQTSSSAGGFIVPLMLLLVIAAAASGSSGGGAGAGGGVMLSDSRMKEDIQMVGMTPQGLPLYHYRYAGMPGLWEGVMAQDVARLFPQAIVNMPYGMMAVDYDQLGLKTRRLC